MAIVRSSITRSPEPTWISTRSWLPLPSTTRRLRPGPLRVRSSTSISIAPVVSVMRLQASAARSMRSPLAAAATSARSEPGPSSSQLVTFRVAPPAGTSARRSRRSASRCALSGVI
ncbi:MAG: hypothetical protein DI564_10785 [Rhodanobacter denitrificans]|uniref:Uncharacterized protein n=1 Tax=Rhodanobacter denitrificans TaxID=666685 RepID=A0A2W5KDC0_9GAMM|nr:MAG: hypothetical protein DI564_10785 [Rhodanobacter denitrificans]